MNIQKEIAPHITGIIARLQAAGYEAYIVGGAIRDILLGRKPKDYDVATSATPAEVRKVFRDRRTLLIGRRFQLVHVFHKDEIIEVSTFRRCPAEDQNAFRKPDRPAPEHMIFQDNEFGCAEEDAWRRDFTVNALFYDPIDNEIKDYTGMGLADLRNNTVRCIGDPAIRFEEDPVRILRALKLAGQYGFTIDPVTEKAITESVKLIILVSPSRLPLELEKILKNAYSQEILKTFRKYGFLQYFLPYIDKHWGTPECEYMLKLLEERNRRILAGLYRDSISIGMSAFTLPYAESIFNISGKEEENSVSAPGSLWTKKPDFDQFDDILHAVLKPQQPTRRSTAAAVKILMMQPRLRSAASLKPGEREKLPQNRSYSHARELILVQNAVLWNDAELESLLPVPDHVPQPGKARYHSHARKGRAFQRPEFRKETPPDAGNKTETKTETKTENDGE